MKAVFRFSNTHAGVFARCTDADRDTLKQVSVLMFKFSILCVLDQVYFSCISIVAVRLPCGAWQPLTIEKSGKNLKNPKFHAPF